MDTNLKWELFPHAFSTSYHSYHTPSPRPICPILAHSYDKAELDKSCWVGDRAGTATAVVVGVVAPVDVVCGSWYNVNAS